MIPGILNTPELNPGQSLEESLGHIGSPNKSTWSSARSGLIFWLQNCGQPTRDITGVRSGWGDAGPDVPYSKSWGNLAGGWDETTKSSPSSARLKTDGPPRREQ